MEKQSQTKGIIRSLGLVFGDIGTSPIYTVTVVFLLLKPTHDNVIGVLSLIVWTLVTLVTVQYAWLAMSLSRRGEGGDIVLREIFLSLTGSKKRLLFIAILPIISVSLLIGDGVITPAISILSAVEGSRLIPGLKNLPNLSIVFIAGIIAIILFSFQRKGTEKVAGAFGPIMVVWFTSLATVGILSVLEAPEVLKALNPYYGIKFLSDNGFIGFIALGEIILCATGGEALYADMGHLGGKPIRQAWSGVFIALVLNYLGQGAFLLRYPETKTILFEMVFHYIEILYIPFLLLSITATVIASQAMISGMFSIVYQGINTRLMPMFKVDYTSTERRSQIYLSSVNWFLLISVLFIMFEFKESSSLAAAYGLAVTGTMTLTGIMMALIFYLKKKPLLSAISVLVTCIDVAYFTANFYKIPHGGYWSLIIASIPFGMIILYTKGQKRLYRNMSFMPLEEFLHKFTRVYETTERIKGTVLFLIRDAKELPFYITQTMFYHGILYEDNILVSIIKRDDPFGVTGFFKEGLAKGLRVFEIQMGYMEMVDIEEILREAGVEERSVFYGVEEIATSNPIWKAFYFIKRNTSTFIRFYQFPPKKLHGVITKVEL
ncbi:MAG: potassium transporter Kup [Nitrospirae bacterium RIFOXYB2_FULL_43_5]|nr:MAG: potassium transporter Kup [Nitrospirae bacterium GWF2_44_13]OGW65378.1 MAG: potassium transporter Kup [Nitrospirae bacterium RIFOXYA2_FULL_44_9]OGW76475.1 MAG: potassium transporter Kup [Nitrospirae bacterium RIFOXYB2_FULL_43_5]HBG93587.1 potassium transporter Kup [Nitrospiraceae bacterium]